MSSVTTRRSLRLNGHEQPLVDLTLAIVAISGWNRFSIAFRSPVGTYQPRKAMPTNVIA